MVEKILSGWGNYPRVECELSTPGSAAEIVRDLQRAASNGANRTQLISRGLGRSYGDPAVSDRGVVLDLTELDRYLDFDPEQGLLTCEAGVSLAQIIADFTPRGFFPLITPGTKFVTVGGCIANDIHGKAHHVDGTFVNCVESFEIADYRGQIHRCSREQNSDLFWANFGGLGLLGVILQATIRLRRIETTYFRQRAIVARDLDEMLDAFEQTADEPYSVAWIDPLATGKRLGRGVLVVGHCAALDELPQRLSYDPLRISPPPRIRVPFDLPNFALNPLTLRLLNVVLGQVQARGGAIAHYEKFFYPLDAIDEWNRGYGKRGFTQYQLVIPLEDGRRRMRQLLEHIARSGQLPFLNVLKKLGPKSELLSFPFEGYTFAIDFPISPGLRELLADLDRMVLDAGGRIYLGKDAFVEPDTLAKMYPELDEWRAIKDRYDPDHVFSSSLSRRVGLTR